MYSGTSSTKLETVSGRQKKKKRGLSAGGSGEKKIGPALRK